MNNPNIGRNKTVTKNDTTALKTLIGQKMLNLFFEKAKAMYIKLVNTSKISTIQI